MSLSPLEEHIFAYYVENGADQLEMVGRFWPYGELALIVEDKVQFAVRKFGYKAQMTSPKVARAFLDLMIERGGFSHVKGELGGTMHQQQVAAYKDVLKQLRETNPIVQKSKTAGADFWKDAFASA